MNFKDYYSKNKTYRTFTDKRLEKIINIVFDEKPKNILDVGCGGGHLLSEIQKRMPEAKLTGVDVYETKKKGITFKVADINNGLPFQSAAFDCLILGEVIEHIPDPDALLREIRRVLKKNGIFIISTPNLASWANRILLPLGVQPLYTETSSEVNLGRFYNFLGQGDKVQGHLKIFTYKSLQEILEKEKFLILSKYGITFFFPFPISLVDRFFSKFISLSSGLLFVCKK